LHGKKIESGVSTGIQYMGFFLAFVTYDCPDLISLLMTVRIWSRIQCLVKVPEISTHWL